MAEILFSYSENEKSKIWEKARPYGTNDPGIWRVDTFGAVIRFDAYGNCEHKYGWEVDHIKPKSEGGSDEPENLRPLYWKNNRARNQEPDGNGDKVFYKYDQNKEGNFTEAKMKDR